MVEDDALENGSDRLASLREQQTRLKREIEEEVARRRHELREHFDAILERDGLAIEEVYPELASKAPQTPARRARAKRTRQPAAE